MKKRHWFIAAGVAISLHAGAFYGAFLGIKDDDIAAEKQGIEFDLGMIGNMGAATDTLVTQAETLPPEPEPTAEPAPVVKPEPEPMVEPDPVIEPEPIVEPEVKPEPRVEMQQQSEIVAPELETKPKPKPKAESKPEAKTKPAPQPKYSPKAAPFVKTDNTQDKKKATTGRASATTHGGQAESRVDYLARLNAKLDKYKRYPRASRHRGETGSVTLSFWIQPNGEVRDIGVLESSGSRRLDNAAIDTIKRAQPLPTFLHGMFPTAFKTTSSITFILSDQGHL